MNEPNLVRRLTTIVAIDVVGFSTMSARDEEHALELLGARMAMVDAIVRHHRGRDFKATGDGMLAEFASPVEAVRAAVEIQEAMRSANAPAGPTDQLVLRIGVNLGDVVENGEDLMGDAVNVAVRLESIAPHGGVCLSAGTYEQIVGKLTLGAEDMGEQHVKNIPRPIHAYRLTLGGSAPVAAAAPPAAPPAAARRPSGVALVAACLAAVVVLAAAGWWLLRDHTRPVTIAASQMPPSPPPTDATPAVVGSPATPSIPPVPSPPASTAPATATTTEATRPYVPAEVPFVSDWRRRALDNYERAEDFKALAINARGIMAFAARRVDAATARRVALEECRVAVEREVPIVRDFDRCMIYAVGNDVVWSFRPPPLPPPPYVPAARPLPPIALDPATVPLLHEPGRRSLTDHYMKSERKRAFVMGHNHFDWWAPNETEADAIKRNLQTCGHVTGRPCVVYAIENEVVVRAPQRHRVLDILTPQGLSLDASQHEAVERYLVANDWRAIAVAHNGRLGIAASHASEAAAVDEAVRQCIQAGGTECAVAAVGPFLVAPK